MELLTELVSSSTLSILLIYISSRKISYLSVDKLALIELLRELVSSNSLSILLISISSRVISYLMISLHLWNYLTNLYHLVLYIYC